MTSTSATDLPHVLRYTAFPAPAAASAEQVGGNPAGVVLDATGLSDEAMQRIASEIGYSETAFVTGTTTPTPTSTSTSPTTKPAPPTRTTDAGVETRRSIRYFSPHAEVPFCGHATIATAVALAERAGTGRLSFDTPIGAIVIETSAEAGQIVAAFTSVVPEVKPLDASVRSALLTLLGLTEADLDERYPLLSAYAGNWHPLVFVRDQTTFDTMTFDPAEARRMMDVEGWAGTISVLHAAAGPGAEGKADAAAGSPAGSAASTMTSPVHEFEARNIFPVGAITEDPATGSAAASLGGYLRETGILTAPARVLIHQGRHVGRPSLLTVEIPVAGGIVVSGTAAPIV